MGLTSFAFFALLAMGTISLPWLLLVLWRRAPRSSRWTAFLLVSGVMLAQGSAIAVVCVGVNRQFGFFPTWGALFGHPPPIPPAPALPSGSSPRAMDPRLRSEPADDSGRLQTFTVHGERSGITEKVIAWLPPQYSDPAFSAARFPVVTMLGPAYLSVSSFVDQLGFGKTAAAEIRSGRVAPFVAVFPEINVQLPVDTECTDVPGGSQGYTWLAEDVPSWAERVLRVQPRGHAWSVMGYSTGGFCATKLQLREATTYAAAGSLEGYFRPELDGTTGNLAELYAASPTLAQLNSPEELIKDPARAAAARVLVMTSKSDPQSYDASMRFIDLARGVSRVQLYLVPGVGHSFGAVRSVLPSALGWLAAQAQE